jgi:uncharacterized protein (DUF2267 family)
MHLISQLPMLLKAVYVNGWHIDRKNHIRNMDDFVECLMLQNPRTTPHDFGTDDKAKEKTKAVLKVLKHHITGGELKHIIDQFPTELTELWITEEEPV